MTTKVKTKKRFHVSLPIPSEEMLVKLAERDGVPVATKAAELLSEALEWHEDQVWAQLVEERKMDDPNTKWLSLEEVETALKLN